MKTTFTISTLVLALATTFSAHADNQKSNVKVKKTNQPEINLVATEPGAAMITYSHVYHLTMEQLDKIENEQLNIEVKLENRVLNYDIKNKDTGLGVPTYNFKNLPGINGQVHVLWLATDLQKVGTQVFNFDPTERVETLSLVMPKGFTYNNFDQCNAIIMTYQLKETNKPVNIVRYNYAQEDVYGKTTMVISEEKPDFCNIKAPDLRNTATITDNHLVNFSVNPTQTAKTGNLVITAHTTEDGQMKLIEANETILISKDFTNLHFITAQEPKGSSDIMKKFYGVPFVSDKVSTGDYIIGLNFTEGGKKPWAWAQINVK